jgi:serine phosphatase RsbU (regulator of sigma subunit)/pSer/pThr/pTyr-binding forkhead associated (FHA) protein
MAELIVHSPSGTSSRFPLSRIRTTIGRSARSDVCIVDSFASRLHAEIAFDGETALLTDLGSANGTRLNGVLITEPVRLSPMDEFRIGETVFQIDYDNRPPDVAALIAGGTDALDPSRTISFSVRQRSTEFLGSKFSSRNELLALIGKVGVALLSSNGLEETLGQVVGLVFDAVPAERCVVMLRNRGTGEMQVAVARMRGQSAPVDEVRISRTVLEEVLSQGNAVLTSDAQHDPRYASQTMALLGIRSVLAVPLSVEGTEIFGLVYADSPTDEATFGEEHLNILTTLASVAAIRVENARLLEERFAKERLERELALASEIQQRFLPGRPPVMAGYEFVGISFPCYEIGGDYYDFVRRSDGGIVIALGDVSGKGTAAALLMSSVHAAVHAQIAAGQPVEAIPGRVNEYLVENTPANRFVTLFLAELSPQTNLLRLVNAGHNPPLVLRSSGEISEIESGGLPLGMLAAADYEAGDAALSAGDFLVVYSDGVTEAVDVNGEEFGLERLKQVLREGYLDSASALRDRIENALSAFTTTAPAADDITLVIVKRSV